MTSKAWHREKPRGILIEIWNAVRLLALHVVRTVVLVIARSAPSPLAVAITGTVAVPLTLNATPGATRAEGGPESVTAVTAIKAFYTASNRSVTVGSCDFAV